MVHLVVITAALLALLCLTCVVTLLLAGDGLPARRSRGRRESRELRRLDRSLRGRRALPAPRVAPSVEQIAADLRRLDRQRNGTLFTQSEVLLAAVLRAYDVRLQLASRCLGVTEHLAVLDGIDREIERVRVEGQLQAAGLALRSLSPPPAP
jgi:hypothetical protein